MQLLDNQAGYLGLLGENITNVQSLWGFAVQQADNALSPLAPFLASATDDSVATPGSLSLSTQPAQFAESISNFNDDGAASAWVGETSLADLGQRRQRTAR